MGNEVTDLFDAPITHIPEEEIESGLVSSPVIPDAPREANPISTTQITQEKATPAVPPVAPATPPAATPPAGTAVPATPVAAPDTAAGVQAPPVNQDLERARMMAQALKEAGFSAPSQPQAPVAPAEVQLTPEELDKKLGVWKADDAWVAKVRDPDTMVQAILEMREGTLRQALFTVGAYLKDHYQPDIEKRLEAIGQTIQPVQEMAQKQADKETWEAFTTRHPTLADPKFKKLNHWAFTEVRNSGVKFNSREEIFDAIAAKTTEVIREVNPAFGQPGAPAQPVTTATPVTQLPPPTAGASGSAGSGAASSGVKSPKQAQSAEVAAAWG